MVYGRPDEPDSWVEQLAVRQAAARVLQYLVGAADEESRLADVGNVASECMCRIMRQFVTPGMLRRLTEGSFLRHVLTHEPIADAIVIWNMDMRCVRGWVLRRVVLVCEAGLLTDPGVCSALLYPCRVRCSKRAAWYAAHEMNLVEAKAHKYMVRSSCGSPHCHRCWVPAASPWVWV